ncbi:MAG: NADH-quinone oxidoreductase subunit NuoE [Bacteroidota bacterium]|nr:NADH-quinone oxidoreductase subunit NuoE [Bacteroidota bacterium]MDP4192618.1 NADH-quinone oxidoreductase subunit NuoE [Bacteroidota bacterium]MDP4196470.1 NADH-quinone oxidoreductase subunit NuoE [Bacteroidota bacterium]
MPQEADLFTRSESQDILNFKIDLLSRHHKSDSLIPLLQSAQDSYGYIPEKIIYYISELVGIPPAEIYGVITFYAQFRLKPLGKNIIKICQGTACHVNGSKNVLSALQDELGISIGETTEEGIFSLESVACLGCCSLAPVMMINNETFGNLTSEKIKLTLRKFRT